MRIAKGFQEYYVLSLLRNPDIQIDSKFYEMACSSYTYPFMTWLSEKVALMQRLGEEYPYQVIVPLVKLQEHVPPAKSSMRIGEYMRNAIYKAIEDINTNPYSQITIENPDDVVYRTSGRRKIEGLRFEVTLRDRTPVNHVSLLVGDNEHGLVDDAGIPSWEYLEEKMLAIGYGKNSIPQWKDQRAKVWRALLCTWIQISKLRRQGNTDINIGGYLQTMLCHALPLLRLNILRRRLYLVRRNSVTLLSMPSRTIRWRRQLNWILENRCRTITICSPNGPATKGIHCPLRAAASLLWLFCHIY